MSTIEKFDPSLDILRALLWQYNEATNLESLLTLKQQWLDGAQSDFWNDWQYDVFDLNTANDFGVAVWAIILNIALDISAGDDSDKPIWGFSSERENYNNGNFASASSSGLTLAQKRLVLKMRYFQLITTGCVPQINEFLNHMFGDLGNSYVVDGLAMNCLYVFEFPLSSALETVLTQFDLLPRPAGVKVDFVVIGDADGFGFGRYHENFNNGNFYHE